MQITDIRIRLLNSEGRLKAFVSVTFDDCFVVHDMKIIEKPERLFVAMPSRPKPSPGEFADVAHPINKETREWLEQAILDEYIKLMSTVDSTVSAEEDGQ